MKQENIKGVSPFEYDTHRKIKVFKFNYNNNTDLKADETLNLWITMAEATLYSRVHANTRGGIANPSHMEEQVRQLISGHSEIKSITVIKGKEMKDLGMGLFYAVGQGANSDPRCIVVEYRGLPESDKIDIAFVGKGITFDTGGLNMKGTGNIENMYTDKSGACIVMGALKGTLDLKLKKNIVFAFAFAENSVDANSFIPMDILTSLKGLTVEIVNTDAEGRLVLSDTMTLV